MSPLEIALIVLIVLVIVGPKRITRAFRAAGNGVRRLRRRVGREDAGAGLPPPSGRDADGADA